MVAAMKLRPFLVLFASMPVLAQNASPAAQIRNEFDNCVYASFGRETRRDPEQDVNLSAELALQACATEERAMAALLANSYVPTARINVIIAHVKLQLKRNLRDISNLTLKKQ
jgi:hypothetical protein